MPSNIPGCVTNLCQLDPARDSFSEDFKIIAKRTAWQNFIGRLIHFITLGFRERNPQLDSAVLKAVSCAEEILKKGVKLPLKEKLERAFSNLLKVMEANDGNDKSKIDGLIEKIKQISPIEASAIRKKDPQPKPAPKPPEKQPTAKIVNPASPGLPPKTSPQKPPAGTAVKPAAAPPPPKQPAANPPPLPPPAAAISPPAVNPVVKPPESPAPALVVEVSGFSAKKDIPAVAVPTPADLAVIEWLNKYKKPLKELGSQRDQLLEKCGKQLEYFEYSDPSDNLFDMLQRCPNIKQLVLVNCNIGKDKAFQLANLPQMERLTVLNLENNRIGPEGVNAIAKAKFPNLTHLNLAFNKIGKGAEGIAKSENMPKLEILCLSNNEINNHGAIALGSSEHRKNLKILDLGINKISNEGVKALVQGKLTELIELDLSDNNFREAGATAIAQAKLAHLRKLSLLNNKIKPSFMQAIKDSKSLPSGVKIIFEE